MMRTETLRGSGPKRFAAWPIEQQHVVQRVIDIQQVIYQVDRISLEPSRLRVRNGPGVDGDCMNWSGNIYWLWFKSFPAQFGV